MDTWSISETASAIAEIIGGSILAVGPRLRKYEKPQWVFTALLITGISAIVSGLLFFVRLGLGSRFDAETLFKIRHFKTFFGGVGVGALLTLFISGELNPRKWIK